jgi:hypothetical protein
MRRPRIRKWLEGFPAGATALLVSLFLTVGPARAQFAPPLAPPLPADQAKLAYQQASQLYGDPAHLNFSGIWVSGASNYSWVDYSKVQPPLTPKYAAIFQKWRDMAAKGTPIADPVAQCLAFGMPRFTTMDFTLIQTPGRITEYTEVLHEVREVYMDGRPVPEDWNPTRGGRANGHWEGDTLVIETVGMTAGTLDQVGLPYSDKLRVVERLTRSGDLLSDEITLIDPEAYTRPFTTVHRWRLAPAGYEFAEYICGENQRNAPDVSGLSRGDSR